VTLTRGTPVYEPKVQHLLMHCIY